jgi:7-cyano-7-deazaguanine synthase
MVKAIVSLSGGMDSTTVLASALESREVLAVSFSYGSKHQMYENEASIKVAAHYNVPHKFIGLCDVMASFKSNLLKTGGAIPEGHYEADNMKLTVVPARNIIFASILAGVAVSEDASEIWMGVHAGDHAIYPDCRPGFVMAMENAIRKGTGNDRFMLISPFLYGKKQDILAYGLKNNVPYHLTRTCYKDQPVACGKCGSCQERLESFRLTGVEDPVEYESREVMPK